MVSSIAYYITLLRRDFAGCCSRELGKLGLSQGLLFFILYVGRHPGCTPGQLAAALHMDAGHTARSLAKLEQGDFLLRRPHPQDRRAQTLELTGRGREAFELSHALFARWDAQAAAALTGEEQARLLDLLEKLAGGKGGGGCVRGDFPAD